MELVPIAAVADEAVEALLDRAFGPGRHERTAYRVRGATRAIAALSFAATDADGALLGTIQCWPVRLTGKDGRRWPLVMVGPVAVEPAHQQGGIGRRLMKASLAAAASGDADGALCLIGDPEYYGRFFGFSAAATGAWTLPGPVERRRLLARGPGVPAVAGTLGPETTEFSAPPPASPAPPSPPPILAEPPLSSRDPDAGTVRRPAEAPPA